MRAGQYIQTKKMIFWYGWDTKPESYLAIGTEEQYDLWLHTIKLSYDISTIPLTLSSFDAITMKHIRKAPVL